MSKKHSKLGKGDKSVGLIGSPTELINLLINDPDDQKRATEYLINQGSKHKKALRTLLLSRLLKMVRTIEKSNGTKFAPQKGYELNSKKGKKAKKLSMPMPINLGPGLDEEKVIKAISDASTAQALSYALNIQVIEWAIKALAKKVSVNSHRNKTSRQGFLTIQPNLATNGELVTPENNI